MNFITDLDLRDGRVLLRVDFNVPIGDDGSVADDTRIRAAIPTLRHVLDENCACVLMTHLGRPGGKRDEALKLDPVADRLSELLPDREVHRCGEVVGPGAQEMAGSLKGGELLLLENLRFDPGEKEGDQKFASDLASLGDFYVNDAFAACHRKHASVYTVAEQFPPKKRAIGFLVARELEVLERVLDSPEHPFVAIFGGAKVEDKLGAVSALLGRVDRILVGGAMAYTFLRARGCEVGGSKVEEDSVDDAREILERAGDKLVLPRDHVMAKGDDSERISEGAEISESWTGLDIGPETASLYADEIKRAATVIWNGPMGKIEDERFLSGTRQIAEALADSDGATVVGGGETGEVVQRLELKDKLSHVSTGGGAFLAYIAKGSLPAIEILKGD